MNTFSYLMNSTAVRAPADKANNGGTPDYSKTIANARKMAKDDNQEWKLKPEQANAICSSVQGSDRAATVSRVEALLAANERAIEGKDVLPDNVTPREPNVVKDVAITDARESEAIEFGKQFDETIERSLDTAVKGKEDWDGRGLAVSVPMREKFTLARFAELPEPGSQSYGKGRNVDPGYNGPVDKWETKPEGGGTPIKHHYYAKVLEASPHGSLIARDRFILSSMRKAQNETERQKIEGSNRFAHIIADDSKLEAFQKKADKQWQSRLNALNLAVAFLQQENRMQSWFNPEQCYLSYVNDTPEASADLNKPFRLMCVDSTGKVAPSQLLTMSQFLSFDFAKASKTGANLKAVLNTLPERKPRGETAVTAKASGIPNRIVDVGMYLSFLKLVAAFTDTDIGGEDAVTHQTLITKQLASKNKEERARVARAIGDAYSALHSVYVKAEPLYRQLMNADSVNRDDEAEAA